MRLTRTSNNKWLHRFAVLVAAATFVLIFIGGLVTSTDSGLAVPDWPTTYGHFMFSFPLSQMVGGIFYEHGHRMVASIVGMLMVILAGWLWLKEPRRWVRRLGGLALLAVILQGVLGGLTVLFLLPTPISVGHGTLAQIFFCLTVCLAVFTSPGWQKQGSLPADAPRPPLQTATLITVAVVFLQLIIGAIMRHSKAGLAIPDFPLAFGRIIPPFDSFGVAIHFAHRAGALAVTVLIVWTAVRIFKYYRDEPLLLRPAMLLAGALVAQLTLGAFTIWTKKAALIATAHVAVGALILGTSVVLALWARKGAARQYGEKQKSPAMPENSLWRQKIQDYLSLAKPRVTLMVLITMAFGFYLGARGAVDAVLLFSALAGTALVAGGTSALNQYLERELDAKMLRTKNRPLPAGRIPPVNALAFGVIIAIAGILLLAWRVNTLTALLAALTLTSYVFLYTPLKQKSHLSTLVGAVPGALPPMGGWTAARGEIGIEAWVLFAILFLWQLPHFLAIAWMYREDYARGGFPMLPVIDPEGRSTGRQILSNCLALLPVSLLPSLLGISGSTYFFGALISGLIFFGCGVAVHFQRNNLSARRLMRASLIYLPFLFLLMALDKSA